MDRGAAVAGMGLVALAVLLPVGKALALASLGRGEPEDDEDPVGPADLPPADG